MAIVGRRIARVRPEDRTYGRPARTGNGWGESGIRESERPHVYTAARRTSHVDCVNYDGGGDSGVWRGYGRPSPNRPLTRVRDLRVPVSCIGRGVFFFKEVCTRVRIRQTASGHKYSAIAAHANVRGFDCKTDKKPSFLARPSRSPA